MSSRYLDAGSLWVSHSRPCLWATSLPVSAYNDKFVVDTHLLVRHLLGLLERWRKCLHWKFQGGCGLVSLAFSGVISATVIVSIKAAFSHPIQGSAHSVHLSLRRTSFMPVTFLFISSLRMELLNTAVQSAVFTRFTPVQRVSADTQATEISDHGRGWPRDQGSRYHIAGKIRANFASEYRKPPGSLCADRRRC